MTRREDHHTTTVADAAAFERDHGDDYDARYLWADWDDTPTTHTPQPPATETERRELKEALDRSVAAMRRRSR
ncbi:hypothetical protein [Occultella kanbiaonis]|uniref:hypothetical protein n=1 Tax=Occultella kanbiaonis TaxID=2675754 RepID=UPI0013D85184|nr:hypothetical protein [Occultella kanbiaonis]